MSPPAADPADREGKGYLPPAGASLPSPAKGTGSPGTAACHDATAGAAPKGAYAHAYDRSGEEGAADKRGNAPSVPGLAPALAEEDSTLPATGASLLPAAEGARSEGGVSTAWETDTASDSMGGDSEAAGQIG